MRDLCRSEHQDGPYSDVSANHNLSFSLCSFPSILIGTWTAVTMLCQATGLTAPCPSPTL